MALTQERIQSICAYCRIDTLEEGDEILLGTLYDAAVSYMTQAGIPEPTEGSPRKAQFDLCVNHLVLDWYDTRGSHPVGVSIKENTRISPAFKPAEII